MSNCHLLDLSCNQKPSDLHTHTQSRDQEPCSSICTYCQCQTDKKLRTAWLDPFCMLHLVPAASNTFRKAHTETVISLKTAALLITARDKLLIQNQTRTQHYLNHWNISLLGPPQHPPVTSLPQPLLPFLLFHTSSTNRQLM